MIKLKIYNYGDTCKRCYSGIRVEREEVNVFRRAKFPGFTNSMPINFFIEIETKKGGFKR